MLGERGHPARACLVGYVDGGFNSPRRFLPGPSGSRAPRAADRARVTDHGMTGSTEARYQAGTYAPRGAR